MYDTQFLEALQAQENLHAGVHVDKAGEGATEVATQTELLQNGSRDDLGSNDGSADRTEAGIEPVFEDGTSINNAHDEDDNVDAGDDDGM